MTSTNLYQGILYDGVGTGPHPATVLLYSNRLVVHLYKNDGSQQTESWPMSKLGDYQKLRGDTIRIAYEKESGKILEVTSSEFYRKFRPPVGAFGRTFYSVLHDGWAIVLGIVFFLVSVILLLYLVVLPWAAEKSVVLVPKEYEVKMGDALYKSMMANEKIDSAKTKIATAFLAKIDFQSDYPLKVTVVESQVKNAFALPGGNIVVYTKLLDDMKSYQELVALLGHEAGHVTHRHTTKHIFRNLSSYAFFSLLFGDYSGILGTVLENGNQLHQLSYSRTLEKEADEAGLTVLLHNRIDPHGLIALFENLQKNDGGSGSVPEFLSTHPVTENRMKNIRERIAGDKHSVSEHPSLDSLFQKMKGIVY